MIGTASEPPSEPPLLDWSRRLARFGLVRFGSPGAERPGVVVPPTDEADARGPLRPGHTALDVSAFVPDYDEAFFAADGVARLRARLEAEPHAGSRLDLATERLGPPVARPSKLLAIGLNYRAHAEEMGSDLPDDPKLFMKATTAISGIGDPLVLPPGSSQVDYEVELSLVIGKRTPRGGVSTDAAAAHIAGYTVCNDYSERDWQKNRHGQFVKGKSADGFAPLGPVLVPASALDPKNLRLWLSLNGELRQEARTSEMIFGAAELVAAVSRYMTLLPGDIITTGTPSGVCMGRIPTRYLQPGDELEYGIEGIGAGRQLIVADGGPAPPVD